MNYTSKGKKSVTQKWPLKLYVKFLFYLLRVPPVLAGRIQHFLGKWKQLTHDPSILNAVMGYKIDFLLTPVQFTIPITNNFSAQESANVNARISKFLEKGIVVKSSHEEGEFISSIFLRPEKDGSFRMILNLKDLKTFVRFHHFKIPSILVPNSRDLVVTWRSLTFGMPTIQGLLPKSTKNVLNSYGRETCANLPAWLRGSLFRLPSFHPTYETCVFVPQGVGTYFK